MKENEEDKTMESLASYAKETEFFKPNIKLMMKNSDFLKPIRR